MAKMTEEQRALYLANHARLCPYCESDNISDLLDGIVDCYDCGEQWRDVLDADGNLINVQEA